MLYVVQFRLCCVLFIGNVFVILAMIIEGYSQYTKYEIVLIHLYNLIAFFSVFMYYFVLHWRSSLNSMKNFSRNSNPAQSLSIFEVSGYDQEISQSLESRPYNFDEIILSEPGRVARSERRPVQNQLNSNNGEMNLGILNMVPEPQNDLHNQRLFLDSDQLASRYSWKIEKRVYKFTTYNK